MLHLHQSDRLELLAEFLAAHLSPPPPPFQPETILVQSHGMARWVSLRLAERLGICAHIQFPLPAAYVWELLRAFFGELPRRSPFSAEVLAFRIMDWLGQAENLERAPRLAGYLHGGDDLRRYQLAARVADIFDQYLVYRADWIAAWESGESLNLGDDEDWQALLWRDLATAATAPHRAWWMGELLEKIEESPHPDPLPEGEGKSKLPHRLSIFGVSSLPPVFMEVLRRLGRHTEVHLYALNPCREHWGEIRDEREIGRLAGESRPEDLYLEVGHPLLASLGKQGREFFDALAECPVSHDWFRADPPRDSLLHLLQADILELVDRKRAGPLPIRADDRSLQIHVCHSPMREVEVLRDQLLALFDADPTLKPGDVAVLTPDIERYTPYIEAVFSPSRDAPFIPYSIADRGLTHQHPLLETFLALLDLPESRFPADVTLGFLEQAAVQRRFDLSADDLAQIHDWVRAVGARWGRDGSHKAEYHLPPTARHTWRDAIQRMLLGYSLPAELSGTELPLYSGMLPYDDIEGGRAQILGRFVEYLETLFDWAERLKGSRPPAEWAELLGSLADRVFDPPAEDEATLLQLLDALDLLRELAEQAGFRQAVGLRVVKSWLTARLGKPEGASGFLTGEVTFCSLVPMRSLPFRLIAVLGLDYDTFPRQRHPPGFDLMARHPRAGDRSRRLDDRYLFLETLLSAREKLYLSHVGRSIRDNGELPPSPLLSELIDVLKQSATLPGGDLESHLLSVHPLQPFDPGYFRGDPGRPGYSAAWLAAARRMGRGSKVSVPLFEGALPEPEAEWRRVDLESFAYFFSNPPRYLLRKRLNLVLEDGEQGFEVREPFGLDLRGRDQVRHNVLHVLGSGGQAEAGLEWTAAQGLLPHGGFGAALYGKERAVVERIAPRLLPALALPRLEPVPVEFTTDGWVLHGLLGGFTEQGLFDYAFEEPHAQQVFRLWLRHLLLCLAKPEGVECRSVLRHPGKDLVFGRIGQPKEALAGLLAAYRVGLVQPLPFFCRSSHAYAQAWNKSGNREDALKKARVVWETSDYYTGEGENAYYRAVYRDTDPLDGEFERLALELMGGMLEAMVPAGGI